MKHFPVVVALAISALALTLPAQADTLLVERVRSEAGMSLPARGMTMSQVESRFGAPQQKHATVGGASAAQPPITRWTYPTFSVYFERTHVVDAVATRAASNEIGPKPVE